MGIPLDNIERSVRRLIPSIEEVRQTGLPVNLLAATSTASGMTLPSGNLTRRRRRGAEKIVPVCVEGILGSPKFTRFVQRRRIAW